MDKTLPTLTSGMNTVLTTYTSSSVPASELDVGGGR